MQAIPDDLFQADTRGFPQEDPAITAQRAKAEADALKAQKVADAAEAKARKAEEAAVKKAVALPPAKKAVAAAVDEDAADSRQRDMLTHKIRLYFRKLPHKISIKEPKTLPKDLAGLRELLKAIESELHSNGGIEMAGNMLVGATSVFERITYEFNPLNLALSGPAVSLTATLAANKDKWDELVTEFSIAHAEWFMFGPGKRLFGFMYQMVTTVDQANKRAAMQGTAATDKAKQEASDL